MPHAEAEQAFESAHEAARLGGPVRFFMCDGRSESPITGAKMTATNHEATSATAITANSEKQYCPVLLSAKPIGRKPRIVISVPVSMGKAVEV